MERHEDEAVDRDEHSLSDRPLDVLLAIAVTGVATLLVSLVVPLERLLRG